MEWPLKQSLKLRCSPSNSLFQKLVGHEIVMDREEKVRPERIGALDALHQSLPCRTLGDQEHAAPEPGSKQLLLDALGKIQIENKLRDAARACRARRLFRVPNIDYNAECRASAAIGGPGLGARGTGEHSRNQQPHDALSHSMIANPK